MTRQFVLSAAIGLVMTALAEPAAAAQSTPPRSSNGEAPSPAGAVVPPGYVIGPEDVLTIVFWRDEKMSGDVVVRPDGKISLLLLNDIVAAGYTPEQLREQVEKAASKFIGEPTATVQVKTINSRKVHILGNVARPGTYPLVGDMDVLQFIAGAGGLLEYADAGGIRIIRKENGGDRYLKFNYKDVVRGKNLPQNIPLKPRDTVIVP